VRKNSWKGETRNYKGRKRLKIKQSRLVTEKKKEKMSWFSGEVRTENAQLEIRRTTIKVTPPCRVGKSAAKRHHQKSYNPIQKGKQGEIGDKVLHFQATCDPSAQEEGGGDLKSFQGSGHLGSIPAARGELVFRKKVSNHCRGFMLGIKREPGAD